MTAYIIADVTTTNEEQMAAYRVWSGKAHKEHNVEVLVRGGAIEVLEGPWSPSRLVVMKFPTREAAKAFYDGETYQHAKTLREGAGIMRMVLVDGFEPQ